MQLLYADESVETHKNMCAFGNLQHDLRSPEPQGLRHTTRKIYSQTCRQIQKKKMTPVITYKESGFLAFAVLRVIAICKPMRQLPTRRPAKPRGGQRISITMTTHDHSSPLSPPQESHTGAAPTQSPDFK